MKNLNIYIAGYGNVGRSLVQIISARASAIAAATGVRLRVCGLSNSSAYVVDPSGLDLSKVDLSQGRSISAGEDMLSSIETVSPGTVFVDCTASESIAMSYEGILRRGISVVACNKVAFSVSYDYYETLRSVALEHGCSLRFETTVGAALPVLNTLAQCRNCGDEVQRVEAVLSGTLNYIFSNYHGAGGPSLAEIVRRAHAAGYTEPDPRKDLSGLDVIRKITIISRELGLPVEMSDVEVTDLLPEGIIDREGEDFYQALEASEEYFRHLYDEASSAGQRLRYVASLVRDSAAPLGYRISVGLHRVMRSCPLYHIKGTDNCLKITTAMYPSPLVIQGAGAGGIQTASGILNDILLS